MLLLGKMPRLMYIVIEGGAIAALGCLSLRTGTRTVDIEKGAFTSADAEGKEMWGVGEFWDQQDCRCGICDSRSYSTY